MTAQWLAWLAVAGDTAPPQGWDTLGQYGLAGIVIGALAFFAWRAWNRETARADRLETENRELHLAMQDKVIPAVLASVNAITECTSLLRDQQRERQNDYARMRRDGDVR
jgi:HAMP domain-containing protein